MVPAKSVVYFLDSLLRASFGDRFRVTGDSRGDILFARVYKRLSTGERCLRTGDNFLRRRGDGDLRRVLGDGLLVIRFTGDEPLVTRLTGDGLLVIRLTGDEPLVTRLAGEVFVGTGDVLLGSRLTGDAAIHSFSNFDFGCKMLNEQRSAELTFITAAELVYESE